MSDDRASITAAIAAAQDQQVAAVREYAPVLIMRTRQLLANGVDLRDPDALFNLAGDQVTDAVVESTVGECPHGPLAAVLILAAELARQLAEATR